MPALGMAQETGKLVRWLKAEGEQVTKGEPLMEVETDKATVEVESPASGTLAAVTAAGGEDIAVGQAIGMILAPGESAAEPKPRPSVPTTEPSRAAASPKARRLAADRGVDLAKVTGSGPDGAIVEQDVLRAATGGEAEPALWRAMADNVSRSWREAPHFFVIREVDASALVDERGRLGAGVTFTDLLIKAVATALSAHPRMNSKRPEINVGLAVALPVGLIVPVIRDADHLSVRDIAARRADLLERVKSGSLRSSDVSGGTFTLSNLGMYGVDLFTAILTEGQAGILAVGRIADRVVAHDGVATVRPTIKLCLSGDHRQVDGARAAEFMQTLEMLISISRLAGED